MEPGEISIELSHIGKDYYVDKKPFPALRDVNLQFPKRGFVAILGASGSGKTTLLNIIGGLDRATSGDLLIEGKSTKDYKPADWDDYRNKKIGFIFQSYNLIPHQSVFQNVELPLRLAGVGKEERKKRVTAVLERVGLLECAKKLPKQLSGGQQQRVAIARALINDPSIILADEPTGALDSNTSVSVMDLVKEIGKDRCVILVTHNKELAAKYSDRTIVMSDGKIVEDSGRQGSEKQTHAPDESKKKSSMPFFSMLRSAFQNMGKKKGRTALTVVGSSFGIIGVALVLATSNGFTNYVGRVETSVASTVPVSVTPNQYSYASKIIEDYSEKNAFPNDNSVHIYDTSSNAFIAHQNKMTPEFFQYVDRIMDDPTCEAYGTAMSVMKYRTGLDFHFLTTDGDTENVKSVNQYSSAGTLGSAVSSVASLPGSVMHEIYGEIEKMSDIYDVIRGRFPKEKDEMVLIVDRFNRVELSVLRKLGLVANSANYETMQSHLIDFDDIIYSGEGDTSYKEYKCYRPSDYYRVAELGSRQFTRKCWTDVHFNALTQKYSGLAGEKDLTVFDAPDSNDQLFANDDIYHPLKCKIVGVLRPSRNSYVSLMPSSIAYRPELTQYMVDDVTTGAGSVIREAQKDNWFLARIYEKDGDGNETTTINERDDGLAKLNAAVEQINSIVGDLANEDSNVSITTLTNSFDGVATFVGAGGNFSGTDGVSYYYSGSPNTYFSWCKNFNCEFNSMNTSDMTVSKLARMFAERGFFSGEEDFAVTDLLSFINSYSTIQSLLIFPSSLTTKNTLTGYLEKWNEGKMDSDRIYYNDVMSTFTDSLGMIVSVISAVLIAFASISLVVSSVMTAIITYVSVIERTKEIGILRACGARKRDVGNLFTVECLVTGLFAGVIGVLIAVLACAPINGILQAYFPSYNLGSIASLNPLHALLLIALAIVLGFLSGLIPSRLAARKDPVACLRSE